MYKSVSRILMLLLLTAFNSQAQNSVNLGYFGHGIIRPGVNFGLHYPIKTWQGQKQAQSLVVNPSIGGFTRSRFYSSALLNTNLSWSTHTRESKRSYALGIGLGYLARNEVMSLTTDFSGNIVNRKKELRSFVLANIHYMHFFRIGTNTEIYSRFTYGKRFGIDRENAGVLFMELGLYLPLQFTTKEHG